MAQNLSYAFVYKKCSNSDENGWKIAVALMKPVEEISYQHMSYILQSCSSSLSQQEVRMNIYMIVPFLYNGVEVIVECHSNHTGNECKHSYHGKKRLCCLILVFVRRYPGDIRYQVMLTLIYNRTTAPQDNTYPV